MAVAHERAPDLAQLIEHGYAQHAHHEAVADGGRILTYADLHRLVVAQHAALTAAGLRPGDVVALDLDRSIEEVVAVLAMVRAGVAWSAVDPHAPDDRVREILSVLRPRGVWAADTERAERLRLLAPGVVAVLDPSAGAVAADHSAPAVARVDGESAAYVAFTSGSTGAPKGVVIPRRAVVRLVVGAAGYARTGPGERFLRLAPLAFDASTFELFVALGTGAALCVHDSSEVSPAGLAQLIRARGVTVAWLTAGLFRVLVDERPDAFEPLRQVVTGGDVVPARQVHALAAALPELWITNGYGPTENTTFTTTWRVRATEAPAAEVPIGLPVHGTDVAIVLPDGRDAAVGEAGELLVTGDGLATGYLGDPDATAQRFVDVPGKAGRWYRTGDLASRDEAGVMWFHGRLDRQVKVRGFRVEISEIVDRLRTDPHVRDAEVVCVRGDSGSVTLVAALVTEDDIELSGVRDRLAAALPGYAVPTRWVQVRALPLTANGKVDAARVEELARPQSTYDSATPPGRSAGSSRVAASSTLVDTVRSVWEDVLGTDDFDDDESFFDVGGDSLTVAVVHNRLSEAIPESSLRVVDLLTHPTVRDIAAALAREGARA